MTYTQCNYQKKKGKGVCQTIMPEDFDKLMSGIQSKIHEVQRTLSRINGKKRHMAQDFQTTENQKIKDKKKILKEVKRQNNLPIEE